jgi:hypothetical protein
MCAPGVLHDAVQGDALRRVGRQHRLQQLQALLPGATRVVLGSDRSHLSSGHSDLGFSTVCSNSRHSCGSFRVGFDIQEGDAGLDHSGFQHAAAAVRQERSAHNDTDNNPAAGGTCSRAAKGSLMRSAVAGPAGPPTTCSQEQKLDNIAT